MSSLLILNNEYLEIMRVLAENEGELSEELNQRLEQNLVEHQDKVAGYCLILDKYEDEMAFIDKQIKLAKEYRDRLERDKNKLESIAMKVVEQRGKLIGTGGRWISSRKSTSVEILDQDSLPAGFIKMKVEPDKAAIKQALQAGEIVPGAQLNHKESLSYK